MTSQSERDRLSVIEVGIFHEAMTFEERHEWPSCRRRSTLARSQLGIFVAQPIRGSSRQAVSTARDAGRGDAPGMMPTPVRREGLQAQGRDGLAGMIDRLTDRRTSHDL